MRYTITGDRLVVTDDILTITRIDDACYYRYNLWREGGPGQGEN